MKITYLGMVGLLVIIVVVIVVSFMFTDIYVSHVERPRIVHVESENNGLSIDATAQEYELCSDVFGEGEDFFNDETGLPDGCLLEIDDYCSFADASRTPAYVNYCENVTAGIRYRGTSYIKDIERCPAIPLKIIRDNNIDEDKIARCVSEDFEVTRFGRKTKVVTLSIVTYGPAECPDNADYGYVYRCHIPSRCSLVEDGIEYSPFDSLVSGYYRDAIQYRPPDVEYDPLLFKDHHLKNNKHFIQTVQDLREVNDSFYHASGPCYIDFPEVSGPTSF